MFSEPPQPPQRTKWRVYKLAATREWGGEIEAVDEREATRIAAKEFKQLAKKLMAVPLGKGEITEARLRRCWPHHVALQIDKRRGLDNSEAVRSFADTLSVAPLTSSLHRDDLDFVVFCLAKPEDAQAFAERFGGECLPGAGHP
jgi:hypothetical protein